MNKNICIYIYTDKKYKIKALEARKVITWYREGTRTYTYKDRIDIYY